MNLKQPKNIRMGQQLFNFLEWLAVRKGMSTGQNIRMADPFFIPDEEFRRLYKEFLNENPTHINL